MALSFLALVAILLLPFAAMALTIQQERRERAQSPS